MPYINVDEAYILDNTGLQVDQVVDIPYTDAALTDTQKAQARKNIAAGGTNPNLLDNPWLQLNQRGFTSGVTSNNYCLDRWRSNNATIAYNSTDQTIYIITNATFSQKIEPKLYEYLVGQTVTLSCMYADGSIDSGTVVVPNTGSSYAANTPRLGLNGDNKQFQIYSNANVTIKAFKLELGTVSTLANDTPPNYADELDRCQYYFERISAGTANLTIGTGIGTGTYFYTPIKLHPKRTAPTVTYSGSVGIGRSAYETDITAIYTNGSSSDPNTGNYTLAVTVTNTTQTAYRLIIKTGGYIDFSADL